MVTVSSPLRVAQNKKKDFILNLNNYRNTHFRVLNNMKIKYKDVMRPIIVNLPTFSKVQLTYTLYPKTRRLCDVANVCSVHDKFFSDALVELGKLPDDDYRYVPKVIYEFGEIDKLNPRVEITIQEIKDEN